MLNSLITKLFLAFIFFGTIWVLAIGAFAFITFSFYLYLDTFLTSSASALIVGIAVLLVGIILTLIAKTWLSGRSTKAKKPKPSISLSEDLAKVFSFVEQYPRISVSCSLILGLLLGKSSKFQGTLNDILRLVLSTEGTTILLKKLL